MTGKLQMNFKIEDDKKWVTTKWEKVDELLVLIGRI
jgi:hypothetical protein